jgi:hypothetical protein
MRNKKAASQTVRCSKQIGMGTCAHKNDGVFRQTVNQQPVRLNAAFKMSGIAACQGVIPVLFFQWGAFSRHFITRRSSRISSPRLAACLKSLRKRLP